MPLTECPDCAGVVSDSAVTCPTCHRVMAVHAQSGSVSSSNMFRWAVGGMLGLVTLWILIQIAYLVRTF